MGDVTAFLSLIMYVIAVLCGFFLWWKYGLDENIDEEDLLDTGLMLMFWFFVFARVGYVFVNLRELGGVGAFFSLASAPGFNYLFGWVGVVMATILISKSNEWEEWKILDLLAMPMALVISISYIGLFFRGANPGTPSNIIGVAYPEFPYPVFPIDLLGFLWFFVTYLLIRRIRANFRFYGWYKYNNTVARDGLPFLIFVLMSGVYYGIRGLVESNKVLLLGYPVMVAWFAFLTVASICMIYTRSGRSVREDVLRIFTPKEARFDDPGLRRKASLLKLRRKRRTDD